MKEETANCAVCPYKIADRLCRKADGKSPESCPTRNRADLVEKSLREYEKPEIHEFARQSALQEKDGYANRELGYARVRPSKPRIEEIIEFSRKMKYRRLGLAFCMGLRAEAEIVARLFREQGFDVISAICKAGRVSKETIGIGDEDKVAVGQFETMCNPVLQAFVLNDAATDFNVLLGLCVGHDSLFFKYAEAPCTVLAVKDRVTGHNPLAAIYTLDSYYRSLK